MTYAERLIELAGTGKFKHEPLDWSSSPFQDIRWMNNHHKANAAEDLIAEWAESNGRVVERPAHRRGIYDLLVDGWRWETKLACARRRGSRRHTSGTMATFASVNQSKHDVLVCVLVEPARLRILRFKTREVRGHLTTCADGHQQLDIGISSNAWWVPYVEYDEAVSLLTAMSERETAAA